MLLALIAAQTLSASALLRDAWNQVSGAHSITVTEVRTSEEFPRDHLVKYAWRTGGYFRSEAGNVVDVGNPKEGWTYSAEKKIYQVQTPLPVDFSILPGLDLNILNAGWPILSDPIPVAWHKHKSLRVELDGRKALTKETKFFAFFDPQSHLPVGFSANLGSLTQVTIFEDLKINPAIKDATFQFTPPKGWTRVTATTGGWK